MENPELKYLTIRFLLFLGQEVLVVYFTFQTRTETDRKVCQQKKNTFLFLFYIYEVINIIIVYPAQGRMSA